MILNSGTIYELCMKNENGGKRLLEPFDEKMLESNPAKVELRLGDHCYCSNDILRIIDLKKEHTVKIPPNEILFFETYEKVNMPRDLSGHMALKMRLVSAGLLMPSQTQVDPGYSNHLFGMLYNLSSKDITLEYMQPITTLEFTKTQLEDKFVYSGSMEKINFETFVKTRVASSLGKLEQDVRETKTEYEKNASMWSRILTSLSIVIAVVTVVVSIVGLFNSFRSDSGIGELEQRVEILEQQNEMQKKLIEEFAQRINSVSNDNSNE